MNLKKSLSADGRRQTSLLVHVWYLKVFWEMTTPTVEQMLA